MNPKEYFTNNYQKIFETAKFVANRRGVSPESIMDEIEKEFEAKEGTKHKETVVAGGTTYDISSCLEQLRFLEIERLYLFLVFDGKVYEVYKSDGDQFSSHFSDAEIAQAITNKVKVKLLAARELYFYLCHNHPFTYNAIPSKEDCDSFHGLLDTIELMNKMDPLTKVTFVDIGIVTPFDYWSLKQFEE